MFSETRYAMNGDLHVAYRTSREGPRDIVYVPYWFTCCEHFPELPFIQGWVEATTSLGRLIFFDQPGTGASDPVTPGALPTLEQWADSITAVLDDLGKSRGSPPGDHVGPTLPGSPRSTACPDSRHAGTPRWRTSRPGQRGLRKDRALQAVSRGGQHQRVP
jgi:pimeloyl-ACP methyl ester carboxylesterase